MLGKLITPAAARDVNKIISPDSHWRVFFEKIRMHAICDPLDRSSARRFMGLALPNWAGLDRPMPNRTHSNFHGFPNVVD